ncbi:MAG TPA: general secretion pathway protein GspB [Burkholderiales bacterium]
MSFILDALRKSDQQRQRGTPPTLLAAQEPTTATRRPGFLVYGLLAVVLVGAGVVIGWLRPWQSEQRAPATPEIAAAKPTESAPLQATPPEPAPPPPASVPQPQPAPPVQTTPSLSRPSESAPAEPQQQKPKPPARVKLEKEIPAPSADIAQADAAAELPVTPMEALPLPIRQSLPAMTISFHAYSAKPENRMVGINNRILREGDDLAPGLQLEQITRDGMIFGYQGHRFRRGVK